MEICGGECGCSLVPEGCVQGSLGRLVRETASLTIPNGRKATREVTSKIQRKPLQSHTLVDKAPPVCKYLLPLVNTARGLLGLATSFDYALHSLL